MLAHIRVTPAYPQIIDAFTQAAEPLRAKESCQVLGTGIDAWHVEGMRSKLEKLVARGVLTEPEAALFALVRTSRRDLHCLLS